MCHQISQGSGKSAKEQVENVYVRARRDGRHQGSKSSKCIKAGDVWTHRDYSSMLRYYLITPQSKLRPNF